MSGSDENGSPGAHDKPEGAPSGVEHLNIKVTDNNNEVFFKIKRTTALKKLMDAFCERQGKAPNSVRFLFDGTRVQGTDSPDTVRISCDLSFCSGHSHDIPSIRPEANMISNSSICRTAIPLRSTRSRLEEALTESLENDDEHANMMDILGGRWVETGGILRRLAYGMGGFP